MKTFLLCLPACLFLAYIAFAKYMNWKDKKRYAKNGVSNKVVNFLYMEAGDMIKKGTEEYARGLDDIAYKLKKGKKVLTLFNNKPVLISIVDNNVDIKYL